MEQIMDFYYSLPTASMWIPIFAAAAVAFFAYYWYAVQPRRGTLEWITMRENKPTRLTFPKRHPMTRRDILPMLLNHQESHRQAEIDSRQCLSGPHKDDLLVKIDGNLAKTYSSQGQTRTAALSLKLAQREIFEEETGEWPVLLLDDVLSELDHKRQAFVLNRIRGGQVFITCCEEEKQGSLRAGKVIRVENGRAI